jgi:hypothetical protein
VLLAERYGALQSLFCFARGAAGGAAGAVAGAAGDGGLVSSLGSGHEIVCPGPSSPQTIRKPGSAFSPSSTGKFPRNTMEHTCWLPSIANVSNRIKIGRPRP